MTKKPSVQEHPEHLNCLIHECEVPFESPALRWAGSYPLWEGPWVEKRGVFPDNRAGQMHPGCCVGNALGGGRVLSVYHLEALKDKINIMLNYRKIKLYLRATLY